MKVKKLIATTLTASLLLATATGCSKGTKSKSNIETIKQDNSNTAIYELASSKSYKNKSSDEKLKRAYSEFAIGMINRCAENSGKENFMVSPDSVLFALEMTAAGADGDTLDQMLETLVPGANKEDAFLFAVDRLDQIESDQLKAANSVWINEDSKGAVYKNFLKYVEKNFDAQVGAVPFNSTGVKEINSWVHENTNGMINKLLDELHSEDKMVLANALAFDAKWKKKFEVKDTRSMKFRRGDGTDEFCTFLCGENDVTYLSNDKATGFYKMYEGGKYAFVVMLPGAPESDFDDLELLLGSSGSSKKEETKPDYSNVDINEFIADMTAEDYWDFVSGGCSDDVEYAFPQFTSEYSTSLRDILKDMGMPLAFDATRADFGNMSNLTPLFISDVIHKTKIEVNAEGTKAAASTGVIMEHNDVVMKRKVICDRPFAYAIIDLETRLPIFFGTVEHVK